MGCGINEDIYAVVRHYADAWAADDLKGIVDSYHDEVVFHYAGSNPLSGTHRGKPVCLAVLKQVKQKTNRRLVAIRDVLAGEVFGLIVAVEEFQHQGRAVQLERLLRYTIRDGKLSECWIHDADQSLVDEMLA
jgi:ketosteroid isomerase-like protein